MKSSAVKAKSAGSRARSPLAVPVSAAKATSPAFPLVGIGASAGGLEAFSDLLRHLPAKTGMAFVLVQHLDPQHSSELREILSRTTKIPVSVAIDGAAVQPDHIYVIPPGSDMAIQRGLLRLKPRVITRGQHLPIDHFLRSLAEDAGNRAISVILSGTASDGTEGSRAVKAAGGITFAQDEKTARYTSMPHSAVSAGCVDFILPPAGIAKELLTVSRHPYLAPAAEEKEDPGDLMEILLSLLREDTGVDFTHYKPTTLQRRIRRRMVLHKMEKLTDYVRLVRKTPGEIEGLYQDILIHVTGFFRDPKAFEGLRKHVFPDLFRDDRKPGPVRVWVPGCSTGEEVYSLAMAMLEYIWLETQRTAKPSVGTTPFQIFATDISDASLDRARAGLYSEALLADVSPERLRRFFIHMDGAYQIVKPVREMCIFAKQNVAKDPPFSHLDLVSCRNLLIYLAPVLQKRVIPTLHYALNPNAYLMLGGAESLGTFAEYFAAVDKKNKIYQKKKLAYRPVTYFGGLDYGARRIEEPRTTRQPDPASTLEKEVNRIMLHHFVPASIVVNEEMEIVEFRGKTGPYLEPAAGQPTFSLSKMAREGLLVDLRAALKAAAKENSRVRKEGVHVRSNGGTLEINLEVFPLQIQGTGERFSIIVFQEGTPAPGKDRGNSTSASKRKNFDSRENERLKREIAQLRDQLQVLIEEQETTNEESRSANEEALSANEELQSTNEELETAKEELQSTNEELTTLNEELQNRNAELTTANNDLPNLLGNVSVPVVIVGTELHIRRFTPAAQKLLNLLPGDIGRRLTEIRPNLKLDDLGKLVLESIHSVTTRELEVQGNDDGTWHLLRVRPYKTWDNKIDGAVISFQDIDALKRNLDQARTYAELLIEGARGAILILDANLRVTSANPAFCRKFLVSQLETRDRPIYDLGNGQWNIPQLRELLEHILPDDGKVEDFEVRHDFPHLGPRVMMLNARRIEPQPGRQLILLYIEDQIP
jgi:two-component system, chemotaxis family, CheB/CheR fusion protein